MAKLTGRWVLFAAILLGVALLVPIVAAHGTPGSGAGDGWMPWADSETGSHHGHASMHAADEAGPHHGAQAQQHSAGATHHPHANDTRQQQHSTVHDHYANGTSGNATVARGHHHGPYAGGAQDDLVVERSLRSGDVHGDRVTAGSVTANTTDTDRRPRGGHHGGGC